MIAYTGKYRVEGDKFITTVDAACFRVKRAHGLPERGGGNAIREQAR
jgi:hypothetical protein